MNLMMIMRYSIECLFLCKNSMLYVFPDKLMPHAFILFSNVISSCIVAKGIVKNVLNISH